MERASRRSRKKHLTEKSMNQTKELGDMSLFELNKSENLSFDYNENSKQRKTIGVQIKPKYKQSHTAKLQELDNDLKRKSIPSNRMN